MACSKILKDLYKEESKAGGLLHLETLTYEICNVDYVSKLGGEGTFLSRKPFLSRELFCIAVPMASGKTTLWSKFGFFDIDNVPLTEEVIRLRKEAHLSGKFDEHNKAWLNSVKVYLDSHPEIKFMAVHSASLAMSLDCRFVLASKPTKRFRVKMLDAKIGAGEISEPLMYEKWALRNWTETVTAFKYDNYYDVQSIYSFFMAYVCILRTYVPVMSFTTGVSFCYPSSQPSVFNVTIEVDNRSIYCNSFSKVVDSWFVSDKVEEVENKPYITFSFLLTKHKSASAADETFDLCVDCGLPLLNTQWDGIHYDISKCRSIYQFVVKAGEHSGCANAKISGFLLVTALSCCKNMTPKETFIPLDLNIVVGI